MRMYIFKKSRLIVVLICLLAISFLLSNHTKIISVFSQRLKPIYSVKTETRQIGITFDISWGEQYVLPILDILAQENIEATFFLSSPWAQKNPDLVQKIVAGGHEVGSHGKKHVDLNTLSEADLEQQLTEAKTELEEVTQQKITLLRPPNGAYDNKVIRIATNLGHRVIQWSTDSLDWKRPGPEAVVNNVINGRKNNGGAKTGDIILFHASDSAPDTAKALPTIIKILKDKGYELVPIGTLLDNAQETWPPESNL